MLAVMTIVVGGFSRAFPAGGGGCSALAGAGCTECSQPSLVSVPAGVSDSAHSDLDLTLSTWRRISRPSDS